MSSSLADISDLEVLQQGVSIRNSTLWASLGKNNLLLFLACMAVKHFHNPDIFRVRTLGRAV